jgi:hypothetical protein
LAHAEPSVSDGGLPALQWRALTIKQPWAELIARGVKTIETRMWRSRYRGPILIHTGLDVDYDAATRFGIVLSDGVIPRGKVVASATLEDCRPMTASDEQAAFCPAILGRFAWVLRDVRRVAPVAMRGKQGLWKVHQ